MLSLDDWSSTPTTTYYLLLTTYHLDEWSSAPIHTYSHLCHTCEDLTAAHPPAPTTSQVLYVLILLRVRRPLLKRTPTKLTRATAFLREPGRIRTQDSNPRDPTRARLVLALGRVVLALGRVVLAMGRVVLAMGRVVLAMGRASHGSC